MATRVGGAALASERIFLLGGAATGGPPAALVFPAAPIAAFYAALLAGCALSLAIEAHAALRLGLGQTLRLSED